MASRVEAGKSGTSDVNFLCQRCHQPLKIDSSFSIIDKGDSAATAAFCELKAPLLTDTGDSTPVNLFPENVPEGEITYSEDAIRRTIPPVRTSCDDLDSGNGFTLLGHTGPDSMNLSLKAEVMGYLFDVMSSHSEVDHPLCEECTDALLDLLDQQLKITEDECKDYREFLDKLDNKVDDELTDESLDTELQQLKAEEVTLDKQLGDVEDERRQLKDMIQRETEISEQLTEEEQQYHQEHNEYKRQLLELEDDQRSIDAQLKYAQAQLDKLKKTNVFNATFHIWHSGHFGTINNFRLGRLPSIPVDWNEINAAWGQTVLLLHSLANKMSLVFERYRLVPNGNHSYVEQLSDKSKDLPLHGSGGIKFFWDTKFDQAMVAFLDCCQQFKEEVEKGDSGFCLPYRMDKGKIEDASHTSPGTSYSIKIQFNSEEQWTKALKFMLTNLKWGLAWVSSQYSDT